MIKVISSFLTVVTTASIPAVAGAYMHFYPHKQPSFVYSEIESHNDQKKYDTQTHIHIKKPTSGQIDIETIQQRIIELSSQKESDELLDTNKTIELQKLNSQLQQSKKAQGNLSSLEQKLTEARHNYKQNIENAIKHIISLGNKGYISWFEKNINQFIDYYGDSLLILTKDTSTEGFPLHGKWYIDIISDRVVVGVAEKDKQNYRSYKSFPYSPDSYGKYYVQLPSSISVEHVEGSKAKKGFAMYWNETPVISFIDLEDPERIKAIGKLIEISIDNTLLAINEHQTAILGYCDQSPMIFSYTTTDECMKNVYPYNSTPSKRNINPT